jgi:tetratricopeptide (TPR) repeat protein
VTAAVLALMAALLGLAPAPDEAGELARALRSARREGRPADALALLDGRPDALLAEPRVAGERIQLLLDAGRLADARAVDAALGEVREGPPPLAIARLRLMVAAGQPAAVLTWVESAKALQDNPDLHAARLAALLALGRWKDAEAALAALPASTPGPQRAALTVDVRLVHARELASDPDLVERAIPLLEGALELQPGRVDATTELVSALAQWHRAERAEALAREALAEAQGAPRAALLCALGAVRRAELRDAEAAAAFEEALALVPGHPAATLGLSRCRLRAGDEAGGLALLEQLLAAQPQDADALLLRAEHALDAGDAPGAEAALRQVLAVRGKSLKALYLLARALALQGRAEEQAEVLADWRRRKAALAGE